MARIRIWDAPTRLFHWTLVGLIAFSWWSAEAWPNSSMITVGKPVWAPSIAARIGAILSFASSAFPLTSNWTSAECRSRETSPAFGWFIGETMLVTFSWWESVTTTAPTAAANAGSSIVAVFDCTSTLSRAGILKSAWSTVIAA